jgi:LPXTG-site transpeptidase (sortase) family protein
MKTFPTIKKAFLAALFIAGFFFATAPGTEAAMSPFPRNLALGSRGSDVTAMQTMLAKRGYLKTAPTGYFGTLTKNALAAWQRAARIVPSSGYFGPLSRTKMASASAATPQNSTSTGSLQIGAPVRIQIPKLGVNASIQAEGLTADGLLDAPKNIVDVGWYNGSPLPGAKGSAVLTGHVAQIRGGVVTRQGVFYNLGSLRKGDVILVQNDKGKTLRFTVRESRVYDPAASAAEVFRSDGTHLNLITCEGTWSAAEQSYSSRLVVFADLAQ